MRAGIGIIPRNRRRCKHGVQCFIRASLAETFPQTSESHQLTAFWLLTLLHVKSRCCVSTTHLRKCKNSYLCNKKHSASTGFSPRPSDQELCPSTRLGAWPRLRLPAYSQCLLLSKPSDWLDKTLDVVKRTVTAVLRIVLTTTKLV